MLIVALTALCTVADMQSIVASRMQQFDRLVADVEHTWFQVPRDISAFDPANWRQVVTLNLHRHRVTLARPILLDEWLTDDPAAGFEPVAASAAPTGYASSQTIRAGTHAGKQLFVVYPGQVQHGSFAWTPLLQVFDLHVQDSRIPLLNTKSLFDTGLVSLVGENNGICRFKALLPGSDVNASYEFDLSPAGTVTYWKSTYEIVRPEGLQPFTWELRALEISTIGGVELATDVVCVIDNPNVDEDRGVHRFRISNTQFAPGLTPESVQIVPSTSNSAVTTHLACGVAYHRVFDANGIMTSEQELINVSTPEPPRQAAASPRPAIGLLALASLAATVACWLVASAVTRPRVRSGAEAQRG